MKYLPLLLIIISSLTLNAQDSLYTESEIPPTPSSYAQDGPAEIGVVFKSKVNGKVQVVRYYTSSPGNYIARLWNENKVVVSQANFTSTARGWQRVLLPTYMQIDSGKEYTASIMVPKDYDSKSQGLASPIIKGNLIGIRGTFNDYEGFYPAIVYDKVSYMITPVFEKASPLIVKASFTDTLLNYPQDSIQLGGFISGDGITWAWRQITDSISMPLLQFNQNDLNPYVKKMIGQHYYFELSAIDRWGNIAKDTIHVAVVQPILILLSNGTWISTGGKIIVDPMEE